MNFYPFHIGDYATHTGHLDPMEDLAYRRMLDLYYLREAPLPIDPKEIARLIRMRDHFEAVESVLREFFAQGTDGWYNDRCAEEIERLHEKQAKAKASAQASVNARRANAERTLNDRSTDVKQTLNEGSATNTNTKTITNTKSSSTKKSKAVAVKPIDVSDEAWASYLLIRKAKNAPVTDLAILGLRRESVKAGISLEQAITVCCERGWASFRADWYRIDNQPAQQRESFYERDLRLKREEAAKWGGGSSSSTDDFMTIDGEVRNVTAIEGD